MKVYYKMEITIDEDEDFKDSDLDESVIDFLEGSERWSSALPHYQVSKIERLKV